MRSGMGLRQTEEHQQQSGAEMLASGSSGRIVRNVPELAKAGERVMPGDRVLEPAKRSETGFVSPKAWRREGVTGKGSWRTGDLCGSPKGRMPGRRKSVQRLGSQE